MVARVLAAAGATVWLLLCCWCLVCLLKRVRAGRCMYVRGCGGTGSIAGREGGGGDRERKGGMERASGREQRYLINSSWI